MRRKKLKKKHEISNLIVDDTNEQLQHVGTLKYINLFTTHTDTHIYLTCQLYYQRIIYDDKCLSSFSSFL